MISLHLKPFLDAEGKKLAASYKRLIAKKQGVRLDPSPHNKWSYAITKQHGDHWLVNTGETKKKGIRWKADNRKLSVYASIARHSGRRYYYSPKTGIRKVYKQKNPPTYRQIFKWHNQVQGWSGVFGELPAGSGFPNRFINEVSRQVAPQIYEMFPKKEVIKIGKRLAG